MGPDAQSLIAAAAIYGAIFFAPFVQEDAAVLGSATAAPMLPHPELAYAALFAGLYCSDSWKYFLGRFARKSKLVQGVMARPTAKRIGDTVEKRLGVALIVARFVPGTRIPLYVIAGVQHAPMVKFLIILGCTAALYIAFAAALVAVIGPKAATILTIVAVALIVGLAIYALARRYWPRPAAG